MQAKKLKFSFVSHGTYGFTRDYIRGIRAIRKAKPTTWTSPMFIYNVGSRLYGVSESDYKNAKQHGYKLITTIK